MQKMKVLAQFYDPLTPCASIFTVIKKFAPPPLNLLENLNFQSLQKCCFRKIAKNLAKFFGHFNGKKKILQIDSKWSETRKKHEIGETEFLPVAGAGSRWSTNFPCRQC